MPDGRMKAITSCNGKESEQCVRGNLRYLSGHLQFVW